ncbi:endonuclease V [Micromonospora craterilacus]|uniref:Endonuclease V n=1 Tax=Micromonospora craterilacus TaxID=1655439 RepID=A0A2W2EH31_9ACTN|nr:endonuclease V [Micromonospora craterilacus]PZG11478.1 endonuclease V [Micromonospora craterilacus]
MHHEQPTSVAEAERIQEQLKQRLDLDTHLGTNPTLVAGVDVSYDKFSPRITAAAVVIDVTTREEVESAVVHGEVSFPYVPGLLAFREVPILLEALGTLGCRPEVVVCDGYGIAHPRRFGLACHLGVVTERPTFGVAKTPFVGTYDQPGRRRGDWSPLCDGDEVLGRVLRTQTDVKPVFVSAGHRTNLDEATSLTLDLSPRYRLPEVIRRADFLSREALRRSED